MEDGLIIVDKLVLLVFNIIKKVCRVLNSFLSFKNKYEIKKPIIYEFFMFDPRF
jgi:hypothetical protein